MKKALGKGLSALIPDSYVNKQQTEIDTTKPEIPLPPLRKESNGPFQIIPISQIQPNHAQPRKELSPEGLEDLAASIQEKGILQPIVVKKTGENQYELICGERRMRAALLCGLTEIPAVVKDIAHNEFLEWALIENIQREDLNPIEEAEAYQRLVEEHHLSQEEIAKRVGKSRVAIANTLRLLRLSSDIIEFIKDGRLSAGHARALLALPSPEHQRQMAKRILEETLSVRQVEAIVTRSNARRRKPRLARNLAPEITDLENRLARYLGTRVKIYPRKNMKQGRLEIYYFSLDDLDRLLDKMNLPGE